MGVKSIVVEHIDGIIMDEAGIRIKFIVDRGKGVELALKKSHLMELAQYILMASYSLDHTMTPGTVEALEVEDVTTRELTNNSFALEIAFGGNGAATYLSLHPPVLRKMHDELTKCIKSLPPTKPTN